MRFHKGNKDREAKPGSNQRANGDRGLEKTGIK